MIVKYAIELSLVVDEQDSAEDYRREIERSVSREWVQVAGDAVTVTTKGITPEVSRPEARRWADV